MKYLSLSDQSQMANVEVLVNSFAINLLISWTGYKLYSEKGTCPTLHTSWTGYKLCSEKGMRTWSLSQQSLKFCGCALGGWPHVTMGSWKIQQISQSQYYDIVLMNSESSSLLVNIHKETVLDKPWSSKWMFSKLPNHTSVHISCFIHLSYTCSQS
jgi:hypothetical protein